MYKFICNRYYDNLVPTWMKGTRFEKLMMLDKWLDGTFYDVLPNAFHEEKGGGDGYNPIHTRRPSMQHDMPAMIAGLCARKLFGGRHIPRLKHDNKNFLMDVQALVEELKLPQKMLEAVKRGSVGSILILFKMLVIDGKIKGSIDVQCTQYCTPVFNQFEELRLVMIHYLCSAGQLRGQGFVIDRDGDALESSQKYWYIRTVDTTSEVVYLPIKQHSWDPVTGGKYVPASSALVVAPMEDNENPYVHNLGFVQGVWIKNLTGGTEPDGLSTWASALNNFIQLDYISSQQARGLNYSCAPQLVIKGDFKAEVDGSEENPYRDPGYMIRLAADTTDQMQSDSSGHDAFLLETNGAATKGTDEFLAKLKRNSLEQLSAARKDLESIKGSMSGKAIELIDEDFLDLIQELRVQYGTYGYLPLIKKICKAASVANHPLMVGVADSLIDGLTLDFPPLYLPDPQEVQLLVTAMVAATAPTGAETPMAGQPGPDGSPGKPIMAPASGPPLIDPLVAADYLAKQLDLIEDSTDKANITETVVNSSDMKPQEPEAVPMDSMDDLRTGLQDDLAVKPMTGLNPMNIPQ